MFGTVCSIFLSSGIYCSLLKARPPYTQLGKNNSLGKIPSSYSLRTINLVYGSGVKAGARTAISLCCR